MISAQGKNDWNEKHAFNKIFFCACVFNRYLRFGGHAAVDEFINNSWVIFQDTVLPLQQRTTIVCEQNYVLKDISFFVVVQMVRHTAHLGIEQPHTEAEYAVAIFWCGVWLFYS